MRYTHAYTYGDGNSNGYRNGHIHADRYRDRDVYAYAYGDGNTYFYLHCRSGVVEQCGQLSKRGDRGSGAWERWHVSLLGWRIHRWSKQRG